jgi:hypothetical protein
MTPLLHACAFDDLAGIRLFDSRIYVRRPVAGTRITGTTLAAKLFAPGPVRVVLADKADAEADGTIGIDHGMKKSARALLQRSQAYRAPRLHRQLFANGGGRIVYLLTAFCSSSLETPSALIQYLTSNSSCMLILLRSRWSRLVRLSLMFLRHRLDKPLIVKNGQQVIDRLFAVPRSRLDIASQDGLGFFYRSGYAIRACRYSTHWQGKRP